MSNSVLARVLTVGLCCLSLAGPAASQQAVTFTDANLKSGLKLIYLDKKGEQSTTTMVSRTEFRKGGLKVLRNADGNTLTNGKSTFTPHSGYRPPGAKGKLQVGMKWTHTFSVGGVTRIRTCKVAKSGTFRNQYITVANAYQVRCLNKRADKPKGINEQIWFAPMLFTELSYRGSWSGGSISHQLIGIR